MMGAPEPADNEAQWLLDRMISDLLDDERAKTATTLRELAPVPATPRPADATARNSTLGGR